MIYGLINPSDSYTLVANDHKIAVAACLLIGQSMYGLEQVDGDFYWPVLLTSDPLGHYQKTFNVPFESVLDRLDEIADCLDSFLVGNAHERETYEAAAKLLSSDKQRNEWRKKWHYQRSTSLNEIGPAAWEMARRMRIRPAVQA